MDNDLPDNFDLIVIGTGMKESIISAAASRIGKKVLHIDKNDYYGGVWASFNIEGIEKCILNQNKNPEPIEEVDKSFLSEGENILPLGNNLGGIFDVKQHWHVPKSIKKTEIELPKEEKTPTEKIGDTNVENTTETEKTEESKIDSETPKELSKSLIEKLIWTQEKLNENSRKFNLDLTPKLQFARGDFVELLISSNIARYTEYRSCTRVLTWINDHLEIVPCSRSDVFSNTNVTVVEKRMLMKILSTCMDNDDEFFNDYKNKTFLNFLKDKKLTPNLIHFILYAISMSDENTPCLEAVKNTKRFLNSLGRFGKTPFICSMYGSGELPQAFCRLSAVFGGIYCLNRNIDSLIVNSENICTSVICGKQKITAENFVVGNEYVHKDLISDLKTEKISRAIFTTNRSILDSEKENLTLLLYPSENGKNCITIIELGPSTGTCPQKLYIVHAYCKQTTNPEDDLKHCIEKLLNSKDIETEYQMENLEEIEGPPQILWSLYFTCTNINFDETKLPKNLFNCGGPDLDLDFDYTVKEAKDTFLRIFPNDEFLPRAPDPEEIILCDEEETEKNPSDSLIESKNTEIESKSTDVEENSDLTEKDKKLDVTELEKCDTESQQDES